jgi:hypothetical protein
MDSAYRSHSSLFEKMHVGEITQYDFITPAAVAQDAYQVAHGAACNEQGGLLPKPFRSHFLKPVYSRVFSEDIVPDFSFGHCATH